MDIRILGSLEIRRDGEPVALGGRRQRMVLAMLLQRANRSVSSSELIDAVWGPDPPTSARKTVQVYVSRLRGLLGHDRIQRRDAGYTLRTNRHEVDAERFEHLAVVGHDLLATEPAQAVAVLGDALALWRGSPWGDLGDQLALEPDVVRLGQLRMAVVEDRLAAEIGLGLAGMVVGELEALVESHPYRERLRELLMLALYRSGQQARALELYEDTRATLARELGADPGSRLMDLHARILRQDEELDVDGLPASASPGGSVRNPYKGLQPFHEDDARDFFGRDDLVDQIISTLVAKPLVTVVGPSGSGKSSAVRAGVLPALRAGALPGSEDWLVAVMVPGSHPFAELEAALVRSASGRVDDLAAQFRGNDLDLVRAVLRLQERPSTRVLLVIDQFEELFQAVEDDATRERFVSNLAEAAEDPHSGLSVLLTLRADMVHRPLAHARLGRLIDDGQVAVLPLEPARLEEACVLPAQRVGVTMEPELAAELVADAARRPGALPLLQFALTELFDRRRGAVLTVADLERMGGIDGVVARRAEATFDELRERERATCRQVFLRLVVVEEGVPDRRQRVHRDELRSAGSPEVVDAVVERFGSARLLTFDRDPVADVPTVMLPHDALLRAWPRLRTWIDESRADLLRHRDLTAAAGEWLGAGRDDDYLLPGNRADDAATWLAGSSLVVTRDVYEFVGASVRRHHEERAAAAALLRREQQLRHRSVRRLRALVAVLVAAVLGMAGLAFVVADRGRQATAARAEAQVQAELNRARELTAAAVSIRNRDPQASLLLALHAVDITRLAGRPVPPETVAALHWGLQAAPVQYPVDDVAGVVLDGPEGPRGVFPMPLPDLVELSQSAVDRTLTADECATWLAVPRCPDLPDDLAASVADQPARLVSLERDDGPNLAGTTVRVLTLGGTSESDWAVELDALAAATGVTVRVDEESSGLGMLVPSRLQDGRVDLIVLPQPATAAALARDGDLMVLSDWLSVDTLRDDLSAHLVSLGTLGPDGSWPADSGEVFGLPHDLDLESLVWYPVDAFREAGYELPESQQDLDDLVARIAADGGTPWCHGEGSGPATGWPGTDWIEDLLLVDAGPAVYDRWVAHDVAFDDDEVRAAFRRFGDLVLAPGHVDGGQAVAAVIPPSEAQQGMFRDPPSCWLMHMSSFAPTWFPAGVVPGEDVGVFVFPAVDRDDDPTVLGAGGYLVAVTDRPEVRAVLEYLVGPEWGRRTIAEGAWWFMANRHVPLDDYADPAAREIASVLRDALATDTFRFDGSDLMPPPVQQAFRDAMTTYTAAGPDNLDEVLARIEAAWPSPTADASGNDEADGG